RHIGVFGTPGTIQRGSYDIEMAHLYPHFTVYGHACPMWVPLVENQESDGPGADYFVKKDIDALIGQCPDIDTVILGCTHYPLLIDKIRLYMPQGVHIVEQGRIVGHSLDDYLKRHPDMARRCTRGGTCRYLTTDDAQKFSTMASIFVNEQVTARQVTI
ncbi:MAG: aspartate/glutamate racemase family protein, partial [Muribaculaceae bacterium]|nr:aspartate/glutamate racemase family protein [Muribaculaceae bacterium]